MCALAHAEPPEKHGDESSNHGNAEQSDSSPKRSAVSIVRPTYGGSWYDSRNR